MDQELLNKHLELVIEANKTTNITRIDSFESAQVLHIEDSLSGLPEILAAPQGLYADMGSGAGFPGIPIAITTQKTTVLIESVKKKATLLEGFAKDLGLSNVTVYPGRAEELAAERPGEFSVISARALSKLGSLMELASPLLKKSGQLVCYKAHVDDDELNHALGLEKKLGLKLKSRREFYLSDGETYRQIIVFEKVGQPGIKLPRRNGLAQRSPL